MHYSSFKLNFYYLQYLKTSLWSKCTQGYSTDVIFHMDDGKVPAHRALLMARSDVMRAMFSGDFRERRSQSVCQHNHSSNPKEECIYHRFHMVLIYFVGFFTRCQKRYISLFPGIFIHWLCLSSCACGRRRFRHWTCKQALPNTSD